MTGVIVAGLCASAVPVGVPAQPANCAEPAGAAATAPSVAALLALATCYEDAGQAVRALDTLESALELASAGGGDAAGTIAVHGRLGRVHAGLGDHENALASLERGIDLAEAASLPAAAAPLLNDLGSVQMAMDDALAGLASFADSHRLAAPSSALGLTAGVNLARALHETGAVDAAAARLDALARDARGLDASRSKAALLLSLAELYGELGSRAGTARVPVGTLLTEALEIATTLDDAQLVSFAHGELGRQFADRGATARALRHTREAALVAQAEGLTGSLYRWEWQAGRLLRASGDTEGALAAYRSAVDSLAAMQASVVTSRRGFRREVLPLYEEYADLMLAHARTLSGADAQDALTEVQQTLEELRIAEVRNYFENECAVPEVFDASAGQREGVVVVYPMLFADRTELLISTADGLSQLTVDVGLNALTNETRLLREAIEDASSGEAYLAHARRLYDWLIAPLEPTLAQSAPSTLVFVPDGPLRTIPLAVLHDGREFIVERYALATTPALALVGAVQAEPVTRVLASGLTEPVQGFTALPFVAQELASIAQTFPSRVYADESFVTGTLEREILAGGYSIVHMATHAQFESEYRRSFLLTHDDVLTMDELEDVMGSQRFTDRPVDLLVLSACQTAAGDERAALGLAGVAVKAGARSALASLWFINDESTARLISEFYRQLANAGNSKADALRGAQLLLMNDEQHAHPAYWAPFLMIGDWR